MLWNEMKWTEIEKTAKEGAIALVVIGSVEQHGLHLPISTDINIAYEIAKRAADRLSEEIPVVVARPINCGTSRHHLCFPGTISLAESTFIKVLEDVLRSVVRSGFKKVLLFNGHGGNHICMEAALRTVIEETGDFLLGATYWTLAGERLAKLRESEIGGFYHAGDLETSLQLVLRPHLVDMNKAGKALRVGKWVTRDMLIADKVSPGIPPNFRRATATGVIGHASVATREKGEKFLDAIVETLVQFLRHFKSISGYEDL